MESALKTKWGELFRNYGDGNVVLPGFEPKTVAQAGVGMATLLSLMFLLGIFLKKRKKS